MLRLLASLVLFVAVTLGISGYADLADAVVADSGITFAASDYRAGTLGPGEGGECGAILHGCCLSSCSPSGAVETSCLPEYIVERPAARPAPNEQSPGSIAIKREPPIPRFLSRIERRGALAVPVRGVAFNSRRRGNGEDHDIFSRYPNRLPDM